MVLDQVNTITKELTVSQSQHPRLPTWVGTLIDTNGLEMTSLQTLVSMIAKNLLALTFRGSTWDQSISSSQEKGQVQENTALKMLIEQQEQGQRELLLIDQFMEKDQLSQVQIHTMFRNLLAMD